MLLWIMYGNNKYNCRTEGKKEAKAAAVEVRKRQRGGCVEFPRGFPPRLTPAGAKGGNGTAASSRAGSAVHTPASSAGFLKTNLYLPQSEAEACHASFQLSVLGAS